MKKTKIVATIGPVSDSPEKIKEFILSGVNVFRFNTKHGDVAWHQERIKLVREISKHLKLPVGVLLDLQGPEIRIGKFPEDKLDIKTGETVYLAAKAGCGKTIILDNLKVLAALKKDQIILIDDGYFKFKVIGVDKDSAKLITLKGGQLGNRKGVNLPGADLDLPSIIAADLQKLDMAKKESVDFIALSFTRSREDIVQLRREMEKRNITANIIAKIENQKALENFNQILKEADGIMIARGDLGVEIDLYKIPYWQKYIIGKCRLAGKPVITATQMLQSMIDSSLPTRAEVSDVANAVYDYTDAVMLSGETAKGSFPLESVKMMDKIVSYTEVKRGSDFIETCVDTPLKAVVKGAFNLYKGMALLKNGIKAFVVLTETGISARMLARYRAECPIVAVSENKEVRNKLLLSYGVEPYYVKFPKGSIHSLRVVFEYLVNRRVLAKADQVVVIKGKQWGIPGGTSTVSVETVAF